MVEQNINKTEFETTTIESPIGKITITGPKGFNPKIETVAAATIDYCNCDPTKCPHCGKRKKPYNPFSDNIWFGNPLIGERYRPTL